MKVLFGMALLVEVVMEGRINGDGFLQTSHLPKPEHGPFSSSKTQVRILSAIVQPAARFLFRYVSNVLHCSAVRSEFVGYDDFR